MRTWTPLMWPMLVFSPSVVTPISLRVHLTNNAPSSLTSMASWLAAVWRSKCGMAIRCKLCRTPFTLTRMRTSKNVVPPCWLSSNDIANAHTSSLARMLLMTYRAWPTRIRTYCPTIVSLRPPSLAILQVFLVCSIVVTTCRNDKPHDTCWMASLKRMTLLMLTV